ncbi:hypothetical protein ACH4E8_26815 [Streptomyces sp. NPDC017979]|uniref:hypothetical protein n=1 Tax=Streptomyces sp. NPDC017979 TaxID=3365024 RepID=UPI00379AB9C0
MHVGLDGNGDGLAAAEHRLEEALLAVPEYHRELVELVLDDGDHLLLQERWLDESGRQATAARAAFLDTAREYLGDDD